MLCGVCEMEKHRITYRDVLEGGHRPPKSHRKKLKIVKKINKLINHNFKYKMTLPLIDQKMTLIEQYQRMTTLFINISTKLKYFFKEFEALTTFN